MISENVAVLSIDSPRLGRVSLGYRMAAVLRYKILSWRLEGGERFSRDAVNTRFDTTRMPMRYGFVALVAAGLLAWTGANGARDVSLNEANPAEMIFVDAALSGPASKLDLERAVDDQLEPLPEMHPQLRTSLVGGNLEGFSRLKSHCARHLAAGWETKSRRLLSNPGTKYANSRAFDDVYEVYEAQSGRKVARYVAADPEDFDRQLELAWLR